MWLSCALFKNLPFIFALCGSTNFNGILWFGRCKHHLLGCFWIIYVYVMCRRSLTGCVCVCWWPNLLETILQDTIALYTIKVEYMVVTESAKEPVWQTTNICISFFFMVKLSLLLSMDVGSLPKNINASVLWKHKQGKNK